MSTSKALTTENIVPVLKKAGFLTKEDKKDLITKSNVVGILKEAGFATKDDVENSVKASERRIVRRMNVIKRDLTQRIATVAINTPTRKEFNELKAKTKSYI